MFLGQLMTIWMKTLDSPHPGDLPHSDDQGDDGETDSTQRATNAELEDGWEPPRGDPSSIDMPTASPLEEQHADASGTYAEARNQAETRANSTPFIVTYSDSHLRRRAGEILQHIETGDKK